MPPSYSPCPRPILKRSSAPSSSSSPPSPQDEPSALLAIDPSILSPLVRFPPHTALASTLGSALPYDRSPIVVAPNRCALPERGCPGRTYLPGESPVLPRKSRKASISPARGKHLHPSKVAIAADRDCPDESNVPTPTQSPRLDHFPALPPLVPDLSSESSEDSDGIASPPPELYPSSLSHTAKMSLEQSLMNLTLAGTNAPSSSALSFLPHPPSPRVRPSTSPTQPPALHTASSYPYSYSSFASNPNQSSNLSPASVRSRSPASPTRSKRKSRPAPIPIPATSSSPTATTAYSLASSCSPTPTAPHPGVPASPERERRSRHRESIPDRDRERREHRERSRERRERERAERVARYRGLSFGDASCRMSSSAAVGGFGLGVEDSGCLGGF